MSKSSLALAHLTSASASPLLGCDSLDHLNHFPEIGTTFLLRFWLHRRRLLCEQNRVELQLSLNPTILQWYVAMPMTEHYFLTGKDYSTIRLACPMLIFDKVDLIVV